MNRRRFLSAIAAAIVATPLAPLVPKTLTWREGQGLFAGADLAAKKVYPQYLYLTTPFPSVWPRDMFLREIGYDFNDRFINGEPDEWRMKLDWPLTVKFDDATMLRLTRERMLKDLLI